MYLARGTQVAALVWYRGDLAMDKQLMSKLATVGVSLVVILVFRPNKSYSQNTGTVVQQSDLETISKACPDPKDTTNPYCAALAAKLNEMSSCNSVTKELNEAVSKAKDHCATLGTPVSAQKKTAKKANTKKESNECSKQTEDYSQYKEYGKCMQKAEACLKAKLSFLAGEDDADIGALDFNTQNQLGMPSWLDSGSTDDDEELCNKCPEALDYSTARSDYDTSRKSYQDDVDKVNDDRNELIKASKKQTKEMSDCQSKQTEATKKINDLPNQLSDLSTSADKSTQKATQDEQEQMAKLDGQLTSLLDQANKADAETNQRLVKAEADCAKQAEDFINKESDDLNKNDVYNGTQGDKTNFLIQVQNYANLIKNRCLASPQYTLVANEIIRERLAEQQLLNRQQLLIYDQKQQLMTQMQQQIQSLQKEKATAATRIMNEINSSKQQLMIAMQQCQSDQRSSQQEIQQLQTKLQGDSAFADRSRADFGTAEKILKKSKAARGKSDSDQDRIRTATDAVEGDYDKIQALEKQKELACKVGNSLLQQYQTNK